jgi:hypothetical protein
MRPVLLGIAFCLVLWLTPFAAAPGYGQGRCLSESQQRDEVRARNVVRPGRLGRRLDGEVLDIRLCRSGGGLVWRATVLRPDGRVVHRTLDARTGRVIR